MGLGFYLFILGTFCWCKMYCLTLLFFKRYLSLFHFTKSSAHSQIITCVFLFLCSWGKTQVKCYWCYVVYKIKFHTTISGPSVLMMTGHWQLELSLSSLPPLWFLTTANEAILRVSVSLWISKLNLMPWHWILQSCCDLQTSDQEVKTNKTKQTNSHCKWYS